MYNRSNIKVFNANLWRFLSYFNTSKTSLFFGKKLLKTISFYYY